MYLTRHSALRRQQGLGTLAAAPFNVPYTQQCPSGSITLAYGTDAWHPNLCQFPDTPPPAPAPAPAPITITNTAPPVTVSPVIQTQVSPQISPVFQQQFQPSGSPMSAGTSQTAPTSQSALPPAPPVELARSPSYAGPTAGSAPFPSYAPGPVTLDIPEDVSSAPPLPASSPMLAPVAGNDWVRYIPWTIAGFAGLIALVALMKRNAQNAPGR